MEDGRLVKIEGNPDLKSSRGRVCAKGQAGVNQVYHPDRLLHPMKRTGKRGEGKWEEISWDEALDLLINGGQIGGRAVTGLKALLDAGTPEQFLFHYGRVTGSDATILFDHFLSAFGTETIGDHNSICMAAGGIGRLLTGARPGMWDFGQAKTILNFGSNVLEAHTNHLPAAQACVDAVARGAKLYTFDVRLSNTASKSTEWIPIRPGTDVSVVLAMCNVLLEEGLYDASTLEANTNVTVEELRAHFAERTPAWAQRISGVPAEKTRALAIEFGTVKPSTCINFRGSFMTYNGVQAQRAILTLDAIANSDVPGVHGYPPPRWNYPFPTPTKPGRGLNLFKGEAGLYANPAYNVSHQILHMIDKGPKRPDIYFVYCHNPVYSNGNCRDNERVYRDEEKIPFLVASDVVLSETSMLADLVLPDATYLERWTCEAKRGSDHASEYYIRQPVVAPQGEARNFCDVACNIARRLGLDLGFGSSEEFVRGACETRRASRRRVDSST